ncbi:immunoglobulin lambda-1 light chain-like [Sorex araneus]|uniref:immunoglobulin lambda-1 light chain-like n=1 Tax=Sorex araneus TaxID=42254 RepID=UPI00243383DC|nr:immunoglobulin lambda-1 light chain-like [Sorex araneus]
MFFEPSRVTSKHKAVVAHKSKQKYRSNSQAVVNQPSLTMNPEETVILTCGLSIEAVTDGVTSQNVVIQESSLATTPGGTVTLTCGSSTGAVTTNHVASWVQQKPYQKPWGLMGGTSNRYPDVPARFSGSLLGNKAVLTITGAKEEDEAEYFCALWFRSSSQAVVTQDPSLTVSPGGTVILTCASSTGAVTDGQYPYWFQQKSGQAPRTMIYNTNKKLSWTPARFSGSIRGDKAALTISGAQSEDEAEYYCLLVYSGAQHSDTFR